MNFTKWSENIRDTVFPNYSIKVIKLSDISFDKDVNQLSCCAVKNYLVW